ncbi:hypothetical protein TNCV_1569691 [Trichonephila clavipes]|uniref:Uncharacterized protein n=1 Tax=Trichonephila clavipes TaxID=2585209 RepID=A0A8X6VPW7_TRICX|nr:hypothetical protein TNCV_1569691 [Trichonephila clavipes]
MNGPRKMYLAHIKFSSRAATGDRSNNSEPRSTEAILETLLDPIGLTTMGSLLGTVDMGQDDELVILHITKQNSIIATLKSNSEDNRNEEEIIIICLHTGLGLVVKVTDFSGNPVPLKTCHVGERCTLNLPGAQTSSVGVVVRRGDASSGDILVT